nr:hypothetical protein [Gallibacterium anatis]
MQRYFCPQCHKTFTLKTKLVPNKIWSDYTSGKQTYQQLAVKYHCSVRSSKNEFYRRLHYWFIKHQTFLKERSDKANEKGYFPYKHRNVRGAYASLKRYMDFIFTYEKYPELNIEKTTNRLEGLFSELKRKLNNHNGLTKKRKVLFIQDFLNKKSH